MQNHMSLVKDVRGCMTRFDPLTPEIVSAQSDDGLTYDELKETLAEYGMSIDKVVFDGSRGFQNAFYSDFEQGHYCWIPFQKAGLKAIIRTMDQQFHSPSFGMARKNREWESFYMMDVPLPMQIYIDGNGVQELIAKDSPQERDHQAYYYLSVYTIQDGEVKKVAGGISHILEGGILESSDEHATGNINRAFYEFYRYTEDGGQLIEKVMYEPDGYWARQEHGKNGHAVQEEEALSVINAYKVKRIELDMKPFSEYPMK